MDEKELLSLVERALDEPADQRRSFLEERVADWDALRSALTLLASCEQDDSFLEHPLELDLQRPALGVEVLPPGEQVGTFRVIEHIASGGMGQVYLAEQPATSRRVALKLLRAGLQGRGARRRFDFEVEVLARLHHPAIARIYDAGVYDRDGHAAPYFALEFVEGARPLCAFAEEQGLELEERIALFLAVCEGVQYGHKRGIVHRDLKPANLLVDAEGRARIIDYGIARSLEREEARAALERTLGGTLLGTLGYMSPEQLDDPGAVDTRSDVYSLGAVLHELVSGAPPFDLAGRSLSEAIRVVTTEEPRPLARVAPGLPRELGWIVARALRKDPDGRYESVEALAADLRRFLAHEPLAAGPATRRYRVSKFVRRHTAASVLGALLLASVVVALGGTSLGLREARRQEALAIAAAREADAQAAHARAAAERADLEAVAATREAQLRGVVFDVMLETLGTLHPAEEGRSVTLFRALERTRDAALRRFEGEPELRAVVQARLAGVYANLEEHETAEILARGALEALEDRSDPALVPDILAARLALFDVALVRGELESARRVVEELAELSLADPLGYESLLRSLRGHVARHSGRYAEALAEYEVVMQDTETPPRRQMQAALGAIQCMRELGDTASALLLAQETYDRAQSALGPTHPTLLNARLHRADLALRLYTDPAAQLQELRDLLEDTEAVLGEAHSTVIYLLQRLGPAHGHVGDMEGAEASTRRAVALAREHFSRDHSLVAATLNDLAICLGARGKHEEAATIQSEVLELRRAADSWEHPDTVLAHENLGRTWLSMQRPQEALETLRTGAELARSLRAASPYLVARLDAWHGRAQLGVGELEAGVRTLREAALALEQLTGEQPLKYAERAHDWAALGLSRLGRPAEAEAHRAAASAAKERRALMGESARRTAESQPPPGER